MTSRRTSPEYVWEDRAGKRIPVSQMEIRHIAACIRAIAFGTISGKDKAVEPLFEELRRRGAGLLGDFESSYEAFAVSATSSFRTNWPYLTDEAKRRTRWRLAWVLRHVLAEPAAAEVLERDADEDDARVTYHEDHVAAMLLGTLPKCWKKISLQARRGVRERFFISLRAVGERDAVEAHERDEARRLREKPRSLRDRARRKYRRIKP